MACQALADSTTSYWIDPFEVNADPLVVPVRRSASNFAAILKASGFNSVITLRVGLTSSILAMYACASLTAYLT